MKQSVASFVRKWKACKACPLHHWAHRHVLYRGQIPAKVLFIGEAPGLTEDKCLVPETPVLMADLTWRPLGKLVIGDRLLSVEESTNPSTGISNTAPRKWQVATVTNTVTRVADCIEVCADGRSLIGTPDHVVMSCRGGKVVWKPMGDLRVTKTKLMSGKLHSIGDPWEKNESYESGWLAGFFDGEGHLGGTRNAQCQKRGRVGYAQNIGPVDDQAASYVEKLGFKLGGREEQRNGDVVMSRRYLLGGQLEVMRFLGTVRPERLVRNFASVMDGISSRKFKRAAITSKEYAGNKTVVDISTTTGTFIANGFVVHNCGQPFIGKAGEVLNKMLSDLSLTDFCIANTVCCIPWKDNKKGTTFRPPSEAERESCEPHLDELILLCGAALELIVYLGREAEKYTPLINTKLKLIHTVAIRHPSFILRNGGATSLEYKRNLHALSKALSDAGILHQIPPVTKVG